MQHVDKPTRQRGSDTPHILDLVISRDCILTDIEYASPLGMSDHAVLMFECCMQPQVDGNTEALKFKFNKGDYTALRQHMMRNWDSELQPDTSSVDEMWSRFREILFEGMLKYIPRCGELSETRKKKFFPYNSNLHKSVRRKHRLWNRWIETREDKYYKQYVEARNKVRKEVRSAYRTEQDEIAAACKNNPKKFWSYVKSKSKTSTSIGDLKWVEQDGTMHIAESDAQKADALQSFFHQFLLLKMMKILRS